MPQFDQCRTLLEGRSSHRSGSRSLVRPSCLLWVALAEDGLVIDVKRGENANRTLRHSAVVRSLKSAGAVGVNGSSAITTAFTIDPSWRVEQLRVVAFVQSKKSGRILSVGQGRLSL